MAEVPHQGPTGDQLLKVLTALGNPHRMRIVAALTARRNYVSALAREIGMGRPLLHMHLQRLEAVGLVIGSLETAADGRTVKYFHVAPFLYELTPDTVASAVETLTVKRVGPEEDEDAGDRPMADGAEDKEVMK
ncbi:MULTISPECIES: ArsR/SmtB family transcription factor [Streptomyces]|uniref:Transcriptional regulator n=2 Tax=Streptomyces TaxID=1883 RepID=A0A0W7WR00_9ACTN|nr:MULTISPECIES: winged helix-turn-helix domain-containing protein [Streptomyces]KUF12982.1 transcriptional regulator [Streptomyces silvensis]MVO85696.1 helix-turn-helix domain-containing protein [Streptomyces typhae]